MHEFRYFGVSRSADARHFLLAKGADVAEKVDGVLSPGPGSRSKTD
jgi:hypothetical protein